MSSMDRFVRWLTGEQSPIEPPQPAAEEAPPAAPQPRGLAPEPVDNDAEAYGVTIEEAAVQPGESYWRVIRIHHLDREENGGRHHIYLEALTPDGQRAFNSRARITWEGGEQIVPIDKPETEPGANFPMWKWQVCSVEMLGMPSDKVHNLRTDHPDEPFDDGTQSGNTLFHHSFLVEFQQTTMPAPVLTGAIQGRAVNAPAGLAAELVQTGRVIATAALDGQGQFVFEDVEAGEYVVQVGDRSAPVTVTGGETAHVTLVFAPHASVIEGVVHNGGGMLLRLVTGEQVMAEGVLGQSGTFRLRNLGPGVYVLHVLPSGATEPLVTSQPLEMDGSNTQHVELTVPEPDESEAPLAHYVLLPAPDKPITRELLAALGPRLAEKRLTFGFNFREARHAEEVTAIGDGHAISEFELVYLALHGVKIRRLTGAPDEIAEQL